MAVVILAVDNLVFFVDFVVELRVVRPDEWVFPGVVDCCDDLLWLDGVLDLCATVLEVTPFFEFNGAPFTDGIKNSVIRRTN